MAKQIQAYGVMWPEGLTMAEVELFCFRDGWGVADGGLGRYEHLMRAKALIFPNVPVHEWMEMRMRALCEEQVVVWAGCATAGKTFDAGLYAMLWWLADPAESSVVLTSTTAKSIRRRMWPVIQELYRGAAQVKGSPMLALGYPGNMVDSRTTLQSVKGDDKHCIAAVAVAEGPVQKAVSDIKGFHPKRRMLLIIDEANDTPEAIYHAVSNLKKGLTEFQVLILGNPVSQIDPHGRCAEPELGWSSVTAADEEWRTRGWAEMEIEPGLCQRFDGEKSPNITAGFKKYPFLISASDVESAKRASEGGMTLGYWSHTRGFWPPEGVCNTVMSVALVMKHGGMGQHVLFSRKRTVAGLDPAFTADGDGCILRFGELGDLQDGRLAVQLTDRVKIPIRVGEDVFYQISGRVQAECQQRGMEPGDLGIDISGNSGKGVADILCREWGSGIQRVEFGGMASDELAGSNDVRKASEVYANRVTELWYECREWVVAGLLKGLDQRTTTEFCSREVTMRGNRLMVLPKDDCKAVLGRSPDDADSVAVLVEVVRRKGGTARKTNAGRRNDAWKRKAREISEEWVDPEQPEFKGELFAAV